MELLSNTACNCRVFHDDDQARLQYSERHIVNRSNTEVKMRDVEIWAKLRQQELLQEVLHEQALRRLLPEAHLSKRWRQRLLLAVGMIVLTALLAAWL